MDIVRKFHPIGYCLPKSFVQAIAISLLALTSPVFADEAQKQTYPISDLLTPIPDFADAPSLGISGPKPGLNPFEDAAAVTTPAVRAKAFADWMAGALRRPDSDTPSVRLEKDSLIVTADAPGQTAAAALLEKLRVERKTQVAVQVRHLMLRPDLRKIQNPVLRERLSIAMSPDAPAVPLDETQVNEFLAVVQANNQSTIITAPRLTLFNRQRAYVLQMTQKAFVAAYGEKKDAAGKINVEPHVEVVDAGSVLDARTTVNPATHAVALELRYEYVQLLNFKQGKQRCSDGVERDIQTPETSETRLRRSLALSRGETMLIHIGQASADKPAAAGKQPPVDMFLLIKATQIIQKDEEAREFPLLKTR